MKLRASTDLIYRLSQRGLVWRPGWSAAQPECGRASFDLEISTPGAVYDDTDLLPVPCLSSLLASEVVGWWSSRCSADDDAMLIGRGDPASACLLAGSDVTESAVRAALRVGALADGGEWNWRTQDDTAYLRSLEWRLGHSTMRLGTPGDPGRIELDVDAFGVPTASGDRSPVYVLDERVAHIEEDLRGALLVHLAYPGTAHACSLLESPLRLPKVLEVCLVTAHPG